MFVKRKRQNKLYLTALRGGDGVLMYKMIGTSYVCDTLHTVAALICSDEISWVGRHCEEKEMTVLQFWLSKNLSMYMYIPVTAYNT